jgi:uncharacterized protein YjiS (DUF1127 family)
MALLLSGERPSAAAVSLNPFRYAVAFVGKVRAATSRRRALNNLLSFNDGQLDDLGINRSDLFEAMAIEPSRAAPIRDDPPAAHAYPWLNPEGL